MYDFSSNTRWFAGPVTSMLEYCPMGFSWFDSICRFCSTKSFVSAPDIARDQMICGADFVVTLSNMIDDVRQICGVLGARLRGLPLSLSLNGVDSNQSVNGSRQRTASIPNQAVSPAPLPQC